MERKKLKLDFLFRASPNIIYTFLTQPSCLIRWFCDEVDIVGEKYSFGWNGAFEEAEMIDDIQEERIRFEWEDGEDDEYLEFNINTSPVTNETIFEIIDFCDEDEVEYQTQYWTSLMETLKKEMGG